MTLQHKQQRVGVFVDVQNMYYSAKNMYNAKVNFKEILKEAVGQRSLIRAIAYCIKADVKDEKNFFDKLEQIGFEVNSLILVSGDGDFCPLLQHLRRALGCRVEVIAFGRTLLQHLRRALGCRVEVIAFGRTSSSKLREDADSFFDLDKTKRKFLIPLKRKTEKPNTGKSTKDV